MKKIIFTLVFFVLTLTTFLHAQSHSEASTQTFDTTGFPQWARDLRRFEIVAFGSYPFTFFFTNFFTDMIRWNNANGMDFSTEGRRYAPWPFKSAGAFEMSNTEFGRTLLIAAGLSVSIALVDFFIVNTRRNRERRRIESAPSGSVIIERSPYPPPEDEDESDSPGSEEDDTISE